MTSKVVNHMSNDENSRNHADKLKTHAEGTQRRALADVSNVYSLRSRTASKNLGDSSKANAFPAVNKLGTKKATISDVSKPHLFTRTQTLAKPTTTTSHKSLNSSASTTNLDKENAKNHHTKPTHTTNLANTYVKPTTNSSSYASSSSMDATNSHLSLTQQKAACPSMSSTLSQIPSFSSSSFVSSSSFSFSSLSNMDSNTHSSVAPFAFSSSSCTSSSFVTNTHNVSSLSSFSSSSLSSVSSASFSSSSSSNATPAPALTEIESELGSRVKVLEDARKEELERISKERNMSLDEINRRLADFEKKHQEELQQNYKQSEEKQNQDEPLQPLYTTEVGTKDSNISWGCYEEEIMSCLRKNELKFMVDSDFLKAQKEIVPKTREILVDWLIELHNKFKLLPDTLHLAVNYLDRTLQHRRVTRAKFQLVGCAAMLLAAKIEETPVPEMGDFIFMTARAYTTYELRAMESIMLNALQFNMDAVTAHTFLHRDQQRYMASYFCEHTLQESKMLKFTPSVIAASSIFLARLFSNDLSLWPSQMEQCTHYSVDDLKCCVAELHKIVTSPKAKYDAVRRKYARSKFMFVAKVLPSKALPF